MFARLADGIGNDLGCLIGDFLSGPVAKASQ